MLRPHDSSWPEVRQQGCKRTMSRDHVMDYYEPGKGPRVHGDPEQEGLI